MRLQDYFEPGNEQGLRDLCTKYYKILNEYNNLKKQPPIKETAQRLGLKTDEYSQFLNFVAAGGLEMLDEVKISGELSTPGTEFIEEYLIINLKNLIVEISDSYAFFPNSIKYFAFRKQNMFAIYLCKSKFNSIYSLAFNYVPMNICVDNFFIFLNQMKTYCKFILFHLLSFNNTSFKSTVFLVLFCQIFYTYLITLK